MNATAFFWYLFKFVFLPVGVIMGIANDSASLSDLSAMLSNYAMHQLPLGLMDYTDSLSVMFQVILAPASIVAWLMPEGSSVLMGALAITGQIGGFVMVGLLCWMIQPPRMLLNPPEGKPALA
jgi:hypothetical protein